MRRCILRLERLKTWFPGGDGVVIGLCSAVFCVFVFCTNACRKETPEPAETTREKEVVGIDPGEGNCPFGKPVLRGDDFDTRLIKREVFSLLHDNNRKVPLWVCQKVVREQLGGDVKRSGLRFRRDPELSREESASSRDYRKSGYDRGHMAPAGDYTRCRKRKGKTFYLSNIAPQKPGLNRGIWARLEAKARRWVDRLGTVYIISGPIFKGETVTIGPGKVAVPSHFYKIVAADKGGKWKATGYVFENRTYRRPYEWESHVRTVERIEKKTGLNFMPELTREMEEKLVRNKGAFWAL